eukprot:SRR837773.6625.p1 GENE.SRR837773.6625~~SRR837773.6625.p1  ORF type:complete len:473 (+),score=100.95 SRR837773.6625:584-2002(+)
MPSVTLARSRHSAAATPCESSRSTDNPVVRADRGGLSRQAIVELLPQLLVLDDLPTDPHAVSSTAGAGAYPLDSGDDADMDALLLTPEDLDDLGGAVCTAGHGLGGDGDEAFDAAGSDDDDDSCSIQSVEGLAQPAGMKGKLSRDDILPLNPQHPALAEALQRSAQEESTQPSARYSNEPDEDELITERLKQVRPKANLPHAHTARPAVGGTWFGFQAYDRRQVWGSDSEPASFRPGTATARPGTAGSRPGTASGARPSTSAGLGGGVMNFEGMSTSQGSASTLTCGDSLAGGALALMRHRRQRASESGGVTASKDEDMDIRELLRRYQTFTQPSCLPADELRSRKLEAAQRRPCTPDVRIHVAGQERPQSSTGRPGSRGYGRSGSGLGPLGSGRSGGSGGPDCSPSGSAGGMSFRGMPSSLEPLSSPEPSGYPNDDLSRLHPINGRVLQPNLKTATGEALLLDGEPSMELY